MIIDVFKLIYKKRLIEAFLTVALIDILPFFLIAIGGFNLDTFVIIVLILTLINSVTIWLPLIEILVNYKNYIRVIFDSNYCIAVNMSKKELCKIDLNLDLYYCFYYIKNRCQPPIKYIAISNENFIYEEKQNIIFDSGFLRNYDRTKVIVFPYDDNIQRYIDISKAKDVRN